MDAEKADRSEAYRRWKVAKLAEDPDYFRRYAREWREKHRGQPRKKKPPTDAERAQRREWYAAHRDERLAKAKAWRDANREKVREYYRDRYARDVEASRARSRANDRARSTSKRAYAKDRFKTPQGLARWALSQALYRGAITKPDACERCGAVVPKRLIHGHHTDYDKPFVVEWLCSTCHGKEHRKQ